jgi:hypothetical protein
MNVLEIKASKEIMTRDKRVKVQKGDVRGSGLEMKSDKVRCIQPKGRRCMYWYQVGEVE